MQKSFFNEHIASWIDDLCSAIENCCRTPFYKGVSQLTRGFVRADGEFLAEVSADGADVGQGDGRSDA